MDPSASSPEALAARVAALEAALDRALALARPRPRLARLLPLALVIAIPVSIAATPSGPADRRLEAREFTLVDDEGQPRARLHTTDGGDPELVFLGRDGERRVVLAAGADEVTFTLRGRDGQPRFGCAVDAADEPHLLLSDTQARPRLHAVVDTAGRGNLITFGDDGSIAAGFGVDDAGNAWIRPTAAATAAVGAGR